MASLYAIAVFLPLLCLAQEQVTVSEEFDCVGLEEKFYPHNENCINYYYCRGDKLIKALTCPFGQFFDKDRIGCVSATMLIAEEKCNIEGARIENLPKPFRCPGAGFWAHEYDCSMFYVCYMRNGAWMHELMNCPSQFHFHPTSKKCLHKDEVTYCSLEGRPITPTTPPPSTTDPTATPVTTTPAPTTTLLPCVVEGEKSIHPDNCKTFYICTNGFKRLYYCPTGLMYDYDRQTCNWDVEVPTCDEGKHVTPTSTTTTTTISTTTSITPDQSGKESDVVNDQESVDGDTEQTTLAEGQGQRTKQRTVKVWNYNSASSASISFTVLFGAVCFYLLIEYFVSTSPVVAVM